MREERNIPKDRVKNVVVVVLGERANFRLERLQRLREVLLKDPAMHFVREVNCNMRSDIALNALL